MKTFIKTFIIFFVITSSNADTGNKWSFYAGMFDFSDDNKKSNLFGIQHINENLYRESFLGTLQPVTGAFITADNAGYIYEISSNSEIGMSYNHISNASLGDKNPGANSYMINFIKKY